MIDYALNVRRRIRIAGSDMTVCRGSRRPALVAGDRRVGPTQRPCPAHRRRPTPEGDIIPEHYRSQRDKPSMIHETIDALMRLRGIERRSPPGYAEASHGTKVVVGC